MKNIFFSILLSIFCIVSCIIGTAFGQNDLKIDVKEGHFLFKNLSIESPEYSSGGIISVKGEVLNNTDKNWREVTFIVNIWDVNGIRLIPYVDKNEPLTISLFDLKRGKSLKLGYGVGETLRVEREKPTREEIEEKSSYLRYLKSQKIEVGRYEINFKSGRYLADYRFTMIKPLRNKDLIFENSNVKMGFIFSDEVIAFSLHNKSGNPITIDWDKLSYVDINGKSHRLIHSGVKFIEKDKPQNPTTVPPTAYIEDLLIPSDNINYFESVTPTLSRWITENLFPKNVEEAEQYKGKSVSIFMPLKINDVIKNYLFTFKIEIVF